MMALIESKHEREAIDSVESAVLPSSLRPHHESFLALVCSS